MAKKQFNFRQTMKKKEAEPSLAKKVSLPKTQKDPEAVKQQVAEIHGDGASKTPKRNTSRKKTAPAAPEKQVRITIDMPASLHKRMKIKAITDGTTIRRYILSMIEEDMGPA